MVFPALFTAGMSMVDATDGVLMVGAYGWALKQPMRKLMYNFIITAFSVLAALIIAALEVLDLIASRSAPTGPFLGMGGLSQSSFRRHGLRDYRRAWRVLGHVRHPNAAQIHGRYPYLALSLIGGSMVGRRNAANDSIFPPKYAHRHLKSFPNFTMMRGGEHVSWQVRGLR
jgi:hypothetical protein